MKSVIAASVLALMTSASAYATSIDADIGQFAMGVQKALNKIDDAKKVTSTGQEAVNAANLVSKVNAGDLTAVYQTSKVGQTAENKIESYKYYSLTVEDVTQDATNVANSISIGEVTNGVALGEAEQLEKIKQRSYGDQFSMNKIEELDFGKNIGQTAVNAANLVTLEVDGGVIDDISQKSKGDQTALNKIYTGWYDHADLHMVKQSATNVANSISLGEIDVEDVASNINKMLDDVEQEVRVDQYAENKIEVGNIVEDVAQEAVNAANLISSEKVGLGEVYQVAYGDQDALNTIKFKYKIDGNATTLAGVLIPATQDATNVINSVSAAVISKTLSQYSDVDQKAENVADSVSGYSEVWDLNQTAVNAANLVSIGTIGGDLELDQVAYVSQNASNLIDANGMVDKVVQSATNVANSVGDLN